jgi:hypothetical protein
MRLLRRVRDLEFDAARVQKVLSPPTPPRWENISAVDHRPIRGEQAKPQGILGRNPLRPKQRSLALGIPSLFTLLHRKGHPEQ